MIWLPMSPTLQIFFNLHFLRGIHVNECNGRKMAAVREVKRDPMPVPFGKVRLPQSDFSAASF